MCYGRNGDNLPSEQDVINLYKANGIGKMRLYYPHPAALQALRGSNIELIPDVPNTDLESLTNSDRPKTWVQNNIQNYYPDVNFCYICLGNDSKQCRHISVLKLCSSGHAKCDDAIVTAGLQNQIKVSTATYSGFTGVSFPPSKGAFRDDATNFIQLIIQFLATHNYPLLANINPYFSIPGNILAYALFTAPAVVVTDGTLLYSNLFDALLDVIYSAAEKVGGPNVEVVVSESGWPSAGGTDTSVENAQIYYKNLIDHCKSGKGTPRKPGKIIEIYLFVMFDENTNGGAETEKHFGCFNPTTSQPKYQLNYS